MSEHYRDDIVIRPAREAVYQHDKFIGTVGVVEFTNEKEPHVFAYTITGKTVGWFFTWTEAFKAVVDNANATLS